jgi:hypothetical protein
MRRNEIGNFVEPVMDLTGDMERMMDDFFSQRIRIWWPWRWLEPKGWS